MKPKAIIEGPPRRRCPILLRQTSFKALPEPVVFPKASGAPAVGVHTARFGEIEHRGVALTSKGRALYDRLLAAAHARVPIGGDASNAMAHMEELRRCFEAFPDDAATLRVERLAFFRYSPTASGAKWTTEGEGPFSVERLLQAGLLQIEPIVYEDFLPVSAAGIFRSNLDATGPGKFSERWAPRFSTKQRSTKKPRRPRSTRACAHWDCAARRRGVRRPAWRRMKTLRKDIGERANSHN